MPKATVASVQRYRQRAFTADGAVSFRHVLGSSTSRKRDLKCGTLLYRAPTRSKIAPQHTDRVQLSVGHSLKLPTGGGETHGDGLIHLGCGHGLREGSFTIQHANEMLGKERLGWQPRARARLGELIDLPARRDQAKESLVKAEHALDRVMLQVV